MREPFSCVREEFRRPRSSRLLPRLQHRPKRQGERRADAGRAPLSLCPSAPRSGRQVEGKEKVGPGVWQQWQPPAAGLGCAPLKSGTQHCPLAACHSHQPFLQDTGAKQVPHPCHNPSQPSSGPGLGKG